MAADETMAAAVRLGAAADALGALAAFVRLETEQLPADPAVRDLLARIYSQVVGTDLPPDKVGAAPVVGLARTFLRQAAELVENPGRSGGWDQVDEPLLQSIGRLSMAISGAIAVAGQLLPDLVSDWTSQGAPSWTSAPAPGGWPSRWPDAFLS